MSYGNRPSTDLSHLIVPQAFGKWAGGLTKANPFGVRRCFVRGMSTDLHDMSKVGGEIGDWMIVMSWLTFFIEVKNPRIVKNKKRQVLSDLEYFKKEMTEGETSFFENSSALKKICSSENEVWDFVELMGDFILRVEDQLPEEILTGMRTAKYYTASPNDAV